MARRCHSLRCDSVVFSNFPLLIGNSPDESGVLRQLAILGEVASGGKLKHVASNEREQIQVQQEIQDFLQALNSYPESFSQDPCLSFEQHLVAIATQSLATAS